MANRTAGCIIVLLVLWVPTSYAIGTKDENSADRAAPEPQDEVRQLTSDDLVRAAIEAVQRLEATENAEARQAAADDIQRYMDKLQAQDPGNPWSYFVYGRAHVALGRPNTARDELLKFVETREGQNDWRAHRLLGDLFVDAWPSLAKPHYEKAAALKPSEPAVLRGLSECMYKLADYDKAVQYARQLVEIDGRKNVDYVAHLARMLAAKRLWPEAQREATVALELAKSAVQQQPGSLTAVNRLQAQYELLIEIARTRLNHDPGAGQRYLNLARLMREQAEVALLIAHHERLELLERGVRETGPAASTALLEEYAVALAEVGRESDAVAAFKRILADDPDNTTAREWLERLGLPPGESDRPADP